MEILIHEFSLDLGVEFRVHRESYSKQDCIIIELKHNGVSGFGEASIFMTDVYNSSAQVMRSTVSSIKDLLDSYSFIHPAKMWSDFYPFLFRTPFLQCAVDVAAYDLWGKINNSYVRDIISGELEHLPCSSYGLGIDSLENTIDRIKDNSTWPEFKIKLGYEGDVDFLKSLRKITNKPFRVDVNCGWSLEEAILKINMLNDLGVTYVEEPLKAKNWNDYKTLKKLSLLPIIADESCTDIVNFDKCLNCFNGVNIKLMKSGGITPVLGMIKYAKNKKVTVMLGCMPESTVGISAISQIASLVDSFDHDSTAYIKNDIALGTRIVDGNIIYRDFPGNGVTML